MKSSELARMAGVSVRTLRHYHAIGLLPEPPRGDNGYRDYEPTHLLRLLRIRQLASLGFSLEQIGPMLQDLDAERAEGDERCGESDRLLDDLDRQLQEQIAQLERQRELIVRIRSGQGEPDYPARAARALEAIEDFERTSHGQGFYSTHSRATTRPRWAWRRTCTPMTNSPKSNASSTPSPSAVSRRSTSM